MKHALDAWALIDFLDGRQPALSRLSRLLTRERPLMSWINLGEVAYVLQRRIGADAARGRIPEIAAGLTLDLPTPERILEAAAIKADHSLSYADAFAVATALAHDAVLLTGDPELLGAGATWRTEDLRPRR